MEFDLRNIIYFISVLILPCLGWVWRISATQSRHHQELRDINKQIMEMPNTQSIHDIQLSLKDIEGSLRVMGTNISHLAGQFTEHEEAINHLDARGKNKGRQK